VLVVVVSQFGAIGKSSLEALRCLGVEMERESEEERRMGY
jgi:hypothetical protein